MNGTKLKHLQKEDLLSQWQKEQREKKYYNPHMFLNAPKINPWNIGQMETNKVKKEIPSLKNLQFGFSARHRNNKEMNQIINNQKILQKAKLFEQI